jgi:hypothetical protein
MYAGPHTETEGLVFGYDDGSFISNNNTVTRFYRGEPTTNNFVHYGTTGQGSGADNNVSFNINGSGTFVRLGYGQTFGGYTIQLGDVVYKYTLGSNGCHYHGNSVAIPSGVYATFTFDYYISPDATNYPSTNYLANFENYGGGGLGGSASAPNNLKGVWQRITFTSGPTSSSGTQAMFLYPGGCGGRLADSGYILYKNPQVEFKSYSTPFVQTTRSSTQSLLDVKNTTSIDVGNLSFNSTNRPTFDGTNDKIAGNWPSAFNVDDNTTPRTWETVVRPSASSPSWAGIWGHKTGVGCSYYCNGGIFVRDGYYYFVWYDNAAYRWINSGIAATANQYAHVVGTFDTDANPRIYVNGVLRASYGSSTSLNYGDGMLVYDVGWNSDGGGQQYFAGEIPVVRFYKDKALSATEVYNNYLAYKGRFGI